jgi:hypothetical protein
MGMGMRHVLSGSESYLCTYHTGISGGAGRDADDAKIMH